MAIIEGGTSAALAGVDAQASVPLHVTSKPTPYGSLGHYALSMVSGTMAAGMAANSDIFQARWTDATRFAVIYEIVLTGAYQLTAFTAGAGLFRVGIARSWSADGSGGTAATLTGDNNQLRTSMGASLFGTIRCATTAALGAGTKTYDTQDVYAYPKFVLAAGNSQILEAQTLFSRDPGSEHPIVLSQNEGIGIRATVPATGTWVFGVSIKWAEVTAF